MNIGKHSSLPWTKTGWASGPWSLDTHRTAGSVVDSAFPQPIIAQAREWGYYNQFLEHNYTATYEDPCCVVWASHTQIMLPCVSVRMYVSVCVYSTLFNEYYWAHCGSEQQEELMYQVIYHTYLASRGWLSYTPIFELVVGAHVRKDTRLFPALMKSWSGAGNEAMVVVQLQVSHHWLLKAY